MYAAEGLTLLREIGKLVGRVRDIQAERHPTQGGDAGPIRRLLRRGEVVADLVELDVVEFLTAAPELVAVMREALLLVLSLHTERDGQCLQCRQPAPCTTYSHVSRLLSQGRRSFRRKNQ